MNATAKAREKTAKAGKKATTPPVTITAYSGQTRTKKTKKQKEALLQTAHISHTPPPPPPVLNIPASQAAVHAKAEKDLLAVAGIHDIALPTVGWELITPEMAEEWLLDFNQGNRGIRDAHVERLTHDMNEGKWNPLNGETLAFDTAGRLADGQHRLKACVKSRKAMLGLVVRGVPDDSYFTSGIGAKKHLADFLSPEREGAGGEKNALLLSATVRLVFMWTNGQLGSKEGKFFPTIPQMIETLEQNPGVRESVNWAASNKKVRDLIPSSVVALVHYAGTLGGHNAMVCDFLDRIGSGIGLLDNSATYHLRQFLLAQKSQRRKNATAHVMALIIKAWNFVREEKPCKDLRFRIGEEFPVLR